MLEMLDVIVLLLEFILYYLFEIMLHPASLYYEVHPIFDKSFIEFVLEGFRHFFR